MLNCIILILIIITKILITYFFTNKSKIFFKTSKKFKIISNAYLNCLLQKMFLIL